MRVGLTGGIASGKSTVAEMFATLGVAVIDTDVIAREVVQPGEPALDQIRAEFGDQVILESGEHVGAVVGIALIVFRGRDRQVPIPFGPYLAAAGWISMLFGETIWNAYIDRMY